MGKNEIGPNKISGTRRAHNVWNLECLIETIKGRPAINLLCGNATAAKHKIDGASKVTGVSPDSAYSAY
jgi:hypothetical protein